MQERPKGASNGSRRQRCDGNVRLKEAGGKSAGRRTGMPRTQKVEGRQMRRGMAGTSPQHRTKSSIRYMTYHVYLTIVR